MSLDRQLYNIFYEGCTHYSIAKNNQKGGLAYYPEQGVPTLKMIEQHIAGEHVLGAYTLLPGNYVRWMAFDVDSKADYSKAKEMAQRLCQFLGGIRYIVEWSGNKGYHILIFFDEPVLASEAKEIGEKIRDACGLPKSGDPHVEVYPKQGALSETNPLGNLLRLPLGQHPTTHNKTLFVDPFNGMEDGPVKDPEQLLEWRVSINELKQLVAEDEDPRDRVHRILKPYWSDGQRHEMSLWTAGYLASLGWTEEAVVDLVTELTQEVGGDLGNLVEAVQDTFEKMYRNEHIRGFEGLATVLPSSVLKELTTAASTQTFSPTLQMIDRIRLGKGQLFEKVRYAALAIISHFIERGRLVRDDSMIYWLDAESKGLLAFGGEDWILFMHNHFGINSVESFGKQVLESVRLYAREEAQKVTVHRRAYWDGRLLFLNLGGPEVYVLSGDPKQRKVILNGEGDILFLNTEDHLEMPNLLNSDIKPISAWSFLVDDLNFAIGDNVDATPAQQAELLKAWIICIFFAQAMPTRPILTLLAPSGAGKTTAARRILRFIEGPEEDVLGVVQDKPDSIRVSMALHKVLVLDNLEKSGTKWLPDVLNRVSTGSHIEIRTLFRTNERTRIRPNCYVVITATDMPFSDETVFTRMLPIELATLTHPMPENLMQSQLMDNYIALWKGMLDDLDAVVAQLNANTKVEAPTESRLADFTVFCARIKDAPFLNGAALMKGLGSMTSRQKQALKEASPFIPVLELWIKTRPEDAANWKTMSELHQATQRVASTNRMEWRWDKPQGLSKHIQMLEQNLIKHFGMSVRSRPKNGTEVKQYKFTREMVVYDEDDE